MATALTPSSNTKHWWPRLSANRESSSYSSLSHLYSDISSHSGGRPHTAPGQTRHPMMTSVTNPTPTSSDAFTVSARSSSRFNLAAVIGFGSKSKKQQSFDIQEPLEHHPLPTSKSNTSSESSVLPWPTDPPNPSLSHGLASSVSGTSRASTDVPLTPADDPASLSTRGSYQNSLMTLADDDPFATTVSPSERRSSAHSDKSLSRRLIQKIDGKSPKTSGRLPMGEGPKKESRDRSATLPTRTRTSSDGLEVYQPLRAVEPPWAASDQPLSLTSPRGGSKHHSKVTKSVTSSTRHSKSNKPSLPWPQTQVAREKVSLQAHQRKNSSSSISKEPPTETRSTHAIRPSTSSSIHVSPKSPSFTAHLFTSSSRHKAGSGQTAEVRHIAMPSLSETSSAKTLPILPTHVARTSPRPPPTAGLPPTPTPSQTSGSSSSARLRPPSSSSLEHHPLRSRSGTAASASSVSFASSISSLSFTSRPSPQDPPPVGASDYPSLLNETLPIPEGADDLVPRRSNKSGVQSMPKVPATPPMDNSTRNDQTPKAAKVALPRPRPLPTPPSNSSPGGTSFKRERALSAASSSPDVGKTLRKQRSFHNTSQQAPAPLKPLRHYSSFDPSAVPGSGEQLRSPPLPPLSTSPLPPPQDLPPLSPPLTSITKRLSSGKDSAVSLSPRRKLFGTHRHDRERERERERKHELDNVDTAIPVNTSSPGTSSASSFGLTQSPSSWFDDRGASSEPASASSTSPSTSHEVAQHIVPPAELLRLGAAWERENQGGKYALRRAKSSWGSRDSDISRTSIGSSTKPPTRQLSSSSSSGSSLPRSASLLSKASSAPSFSRTHGVPPDLSFAPSSSALPPDSHTSLSPPPPRRQHRSISRTTAQVLPCFPPLPRRTPSALATSSGSTPPKGALIERKPSFLDMTTTRQSVTIDVPEAAGSDLEDEYERDSFLELSRGMDSIDTIRESISSEDSFMQ